MLRISEIRTGANADLDQRLMGPVPREQAGLGRMGWGLIACSGRDGPSTSPRGSQPLPGHPFAGGKPRRGGPGFS